MYLPRVQSSCPLTTPAHATILTGLDPVAHGIRDNQHFALRPGVPTLAERFREAGYATAAVVSGAPLRRSYGLDRGFDLYDDQGFTVQGSGVATPASRPAQETVRRALDWLRGRQEGLVFLWVHFYDPHEPYAPPPEFLAKDPAHPYAGEVAAVDARLGSLLEVVRADQARRWIVLVTGDHGEALGDHGEATHGVLLYGSTVDVPLILWPAPPGSAGAGPFGLIDVAPTLCVLAGLAPMGAGRSLLGTSGERWLAAESAYPTTAYGLAPAHRLRRGDRVVLEQGASEVYALAEDPEETADLSGTPEGQDDLRRAAAETERAFGPVEALEERSLALAPDDLAALRSLGYVSGPAGRGALRRVDLRRFVVDLRRLERARALLSTGRHADALAAYDAFVADYPDSAPARQERGQALAALGRFPDAEKAFAQALALDPADSVSALNLGNLALARNDPAAAEGFFKESLRLEEAQPEAHSTWSCSTSTR